MKLNENSIFRQESQTMDLGNMRVKLPQQFKEPYDSNRNMKKFGVDNLYPQNIKKLVLGSPTGSVCQKRYADFIEGDGMGNGDTVQANRMQTVNDVVHEVATEISFFDGFALHISYNGMAQITEIRSIPMETLRLGEEDDNGYFRKILYCADWAGLKTRNGKYVNPITDVVEYYPYSDDINVTLERINKAGGVENYKGEILYVSNRLGYPIGRADSILSVLSTEEGLMNISYRNTRNGFMPGSVLCLPSGAGDDKLSQFKQNLKRLQGDQNAMKILTFEVATKEDKPEVIDLHLANYDKEFTVTSDTTVQRIHAAYKQDAFYLLYLGKVGFGGEVLASIFNLYNISVRGERALIERTLKRLSKRMVALQALDFRIEPLVYKVNDTTNVNQENL